MNRASSVFAVLIFGVALPIWGQDTTELEVGRTVEGELSAGEKHTFLLDLDRNQVVFGEVVQKGIDIVVTVYGPDGEQVVRIDEVGAPAAWESIHFQSSDSGLYRIELTRAGADSGQYAIRVEQIEPAATTPEGRLDQWVTFLDREHRPGGAIAIVRNGELTYAGAFGVANLTDGIPFTTETASNIASVSKIFTAFAVALLE